MDFAPVWHCRSRGRVYTTFLRQDLHYLSLSTFEATATFSRLASCPLFQALVGFSVMLAVSTINEGSQRLSQLCRFHMGIPRISDHSGTLRLKLSVKCVSTPLLRLPEMLLSALLLL